MTKLIRSWFFHPTRDERVERECRAAQLERLEATAQREYWTAMEQMLVKRVQRLEQEMRNA